MKKILGFFKQRWLVTLLGVVALSLFIWFLGPLFGFAGHEPFVSYLNRFIAIGIVVLIWLISQIFSFYRSRKKNAALKAGIVGSDEKSTLTPAEQATQDEVDTLKKGIKSALAKLKTKRFGGSSGRHFLYQLPWYIIIGPPGSGKTTLLRNAQIKFPLADDLGGQAFRGEGGTRNCDWWFAENAVLLDTAGRYTTQDREETDRGAWLGFLNLLKKHRRRRPINGAIVAVSITELLQSDEAKRHAHALAIRKRIHELRETLGIRFPAYLIFTKYDRVAGFMDYFDDLDRDTRGQVWGMTFSLDEDSDTNPITLFDKEFELLEHRLQGQLINKLERERNIERRDRIYTFPQQFATHKLVLSKFVADVFEPTRYQQSAMFRGVYYTSATQEGSPIDRIMGLLAENFGVERQALVGFSGKGKSFFINRLLVDVIFGESGLAGTNVKLERKRALLQYGAVIATSALSLIIVLAWAVSYARNKAYVNEFSKETVSLNQMGEELLPEQTDVLATLSLLDRARALPGGYADQQAGTPWSMTYGLYQGDKLGKGGDIIYKRLLKQALLPRLMTRLEQQIGNYGANTDYLFEALKTYLMLEDKKHYDADTIRAWVMLDWEQNLPYDATKEQRDNLAEHLNVLLATGVSPLPRPLDSALVNNAQAVLSNAPLAVRVYNRLKQELVTNNQVPDFRISKAAGRDAPLVFARKSNAPLNQGLPGLFTYAGYHELFLPRSRTIAKQLAEESWILGPYQIKPSGEELARLNDDVQKRYFDDFIREWETLLADIRVAHFTNLAQVVEILNILSGDDSPLRMLLEAVEKETTLDRAPEEEKSPADKVGKKLSKADAKLRSVLGKTPRLPVRTPSRFGVHTVSKKFEPLNELTQDKNGVPPLEQTLDVLRELYVHLNSLLQASGEELVLDQQKQINQVLQKVNSKAKRQPAPVVDMLKHIATGSASLVGGGACQHLNATWQNEVLQFCNTAISGRYPNQRGSSEDITQEDFGLLFGPGGKIDSFFTKYLASSIDKSAPNWRWIDRGGSPACLSNNTLLQLKRADKVKNAFFRAGGQTPSFRFSLKPMSMSAEIMQLYLDIDGQVLSYAHGPTRITPMTWPGPNSTGQVRLIISPPMTGGSSGMTLEGPWALFRLIDHGNLHRLGRSEQFALTFNLGGRDISLELRAGSAVNPFQLQELQQFRCPQNL